MVCDQCTKAQKIIYGVAGGLGLGGVILGVVAVVTASAGLQVDFEKENERSFSLTVEDAHCGYFLYTGKSQDCGKTYSDTEVKFDGSGTNFGKDCSLFEEEWATEYDPPLQKLGHFTHSTGLGGPGGAGTYTVSSTQPLWALDFCDHVDGAVTGIMAAFGIVVVACVVFIVSCILCCVACCCCQAPKAAGANVVVGAPTTMGNAQASS